MTTAGNGPQWWGDPEKPKSDEATQNSDGKEPLSPSWSLEDWDRRHEKPKDGDSDATASERSNPEYWRATSKQPRSIWKMLLTGVFVVVGGFFALGVLLLGTCFLAAR
jgi:hypothetical protein